LAAVPAANPGEAAQYYPGGYWWAMLDVPDASLFPGTGPQGNGMPDNFQSQVQWLNSLKANGCGNCHQIGGPIMRTIAPVFNGFGDSQTAWLNRLNAGQGGPAMTNQVGNMMTNDGGRFHARRRSGRRAWSETSSSRSGTGIARPPISMTSSPRTSATPR
jgi:hypothetical protein